MTIRRGAEWGHLAVPDPAMPLAGSDAELRAIAARTTDERVVVGLTGGDMMRTVGGRGDRSRLGGADPIPHLPLDVVDVVADGQRAGVFVAHLVARRSWWTGPLAAVMNAQFIGSWDVAPRSHPNDGKVDIVRVAAEMSVQQRWIARSRARLGTHLPHPLITTSQRAEATLEFAEPMKIWLDGERWGSAREIVVSTRADAITVCV